MTPYRARNAAPLSPLDRPDRLLSMARRAARRHFSGLISGIALALWVGLVCGSAFAQTVVNSASDYQQGTPSGVVLTDKSGAVNSLTNPIYTQPATGATDVIGAGENHIGEVGGNQITVKKALVTSNNTVTTGKAIGPLQTLANVVRVSGANGAAGTSTTLQNLNVTFKDAVAGTSLDVIIFDANPTGSTCTDNTTFALVDADRDKVVDIIHVTDFTSGGTPVVARAANLALGFSLASSTSAYACVVARGSFAITSTANASLNLRFWRD